MTSEELDRWRIEPGTTVELSSHAPDSHAGAPGDRVATEAAVPALHETMLDLQGRLWAEGTRSVLVVLQGIDASGKDGTISHVFRGLNPLGTNVAAFKVPSAIERAHDFLWRVHARCPGAGEVTIFNRSHYEDVLVARVHELVAPEVWKARYGHINSFEKLLHDTGTTVVKLFLHISKAEQAQRFTDRETDPTKQWKISDADLKERALWDSYTSAFEDMLTKTSTEHAPWYVVPADHKWYRNWVASTILTETLRELDPQYPTSRPS